MMEISDEGTEPQIPTVVEGTEPQIPNVVEGTEQKLPNVVEGTEHQIPNVDEGTAHQIPNVDQGTEHQIPNVDEETAHQIPNVDEGTQQQIPDVNKGTEHQIHNIENNTMECEQIIEVENPQGQKNIIILVDMPTDSNSMEKDAKGSKTVDYYSSEPGVLVMDESSQESNQSNKGSTKSEKEISQTSIIDNSNDTSQTIKQSENSRKFELHEKSVDVDSSFKPEIDQDVAGTSSSQMDDSEPGLCTPADTEINEEEEKDMTDEKKEEEKDMTENQKDDKTEEQKGEKDDMTEKPTEEEKDMTEEEAQEILMKALKKISPKIGKDFVLMFKDPSTSKVKEFSSDKGRKFLQHNTDVVKKFSNVVSGKKTTTSEESTSKREGHSRSEDDNTVMESDDETDSEAEDKSPVKKGKNIKKKMVEIKPVKRVPRTSVIMKKLAKLDEKERMKNLQVFSCKECSSKFGTMGNLNKHMKNKHNTDDECKTISKVNDSDNSSSDMIEHPNNEKMETNLDETNKSLDVTKKVKDEKNVEFMMKDCGDFETVVSISDYVDPPGDISDDDSEVTNTSRVKRGRGRPPKPKNPFLEPKTPEENKSNDVVTRGRGRPRKSTGISSPKDIVTEVNKKSKTEKLPKITYSDEDMDCFIRTVEDENTRMNLECKLCLLRFSSHRMAREHIVQEHNQNLIQCTKTLEKFPDTTKTSRWDNLIYYIEDDIKEEIIPPELFTSVAWGGRKRTPSKKLLESTSALRTKIYVCKICHRKAIHKTGMLQHMKRFHFDELPEKSEDSGEEEDGEEEEEEEQQEESDEEMEVNDEDLDYKPTHKVVEDNEEESIIKTKGRGRKRKQQSNVEPLESEHKKIKNEKDQEKTKEVHVKIEVVEDENSHVQTNENVAENVDLPTNEEADESKDDVVMDEDATDNSSMTVKKNTLNRKPKFINNRSRAKTFKKVPSYYKYCDHSEEHIIKKSTQQLPFCKTCDRFKCMTCTLTFNKSSHVNRHVRIIHNKEKKYKCPTCEACFTTNESLQYHAKWHTGVKDVECPYCDMKFLVHKNLRKHMNKHHPGLISKRRKKTNYCEICDSIFTRKDRLEYHMLEKHPANNPDRECRICGQKFETDMDCTEHSNAHADMKKVPVAKCPHCPLYCSSKNNLKRHVDRVHLNIKKYLCNECGKRFKGRDAYLYHAKRHVDPFGRDFECHICSKKIATEKGLEIHLRVHTGAKPFVCETCGKGFAQKGNMLSHQAIHFDDRPFECEECHKTFKKKFDLYKHKKRHKVKHTVATGDVTFLEGAGKIYNCPLDDCDGIFCSTTDLRLHMRRHNNEKPYECSICFKSFAVKSRLVRHLRNVHSLTLPDSNLESMKDPDFLKKIENAREIYEDRKRRFQTVMIPQPSGEQIEVQIMTEDTEGVEDLLALSNATTFHKDVVKEETAEEEDQNEEIHLKIETSEDNEGGVQIINVREDSSGEVQIHTEDENIVLDPAIIQTLLNSGQQTIYYYVDQ